jgi:HEPN domain-containing protein
VIKEGKVLYDSGGVILEKPGNVDPAEVKKRAKEEFERWFENASNFYRASQLTFNDDLFKEAAFILHQATEAFYTTVLLVFTGYKGKVHDLEELGTQIARILPEFKTVFPMDSKDHIERFHLLKRAYIDARYKKDYKITKEDLEYLSERVGVLKELVGRVCKNKLFLL